jgi:hypothetical protein
MAPEEGFEPGQRKSRCSTISRLCNDHADLRAAGLPAGPPCSLPSSPLVAATWQQDSGVLHGSDGLKMDFKFIGRPSCIASRPRTRGLGAKSATHRARRTRTAARLRSRRQRRTRSSRCRSDPARPEIAQGNGRKLCKHEHVARVIAVPGVHDARSFDPWRPSRRAAGASPTPFSLGTRRRAFEPFPWPLALRN